MPAVYVAFADAFKVSFPEQLLPIFNRYQTEAADDAEEHVREIIWDRYDKKELPTFFQDAVDLPETF